MADADFTSVAKRTRLSLECRPTPTPTAPPPPPVGSVDASPLAVRGFFFFGFSIRRLRVRFRVFFRFSPFFYSLKKIFFLLPGASGPPFRDGDVI